jgi:hypothetical protein
VSIRFRPAATEELVGLLSFIRVRDALAADEVELCVRETLSLLEASPLSGGRLRLANPRLRELRFATVRYYRQFIILYLPVEDGVEVLHIVRGRRHLNRLLADD